MSRYKIAHFVIFTIVFAVLFATNPHGLVWFFAGAINVFAWVIGLVLGEWDKGKDFTVPRGAP